MALVTNAPVAATASPATTATDIRDIAPPLEIPSGYEWLWWLGVTIVVLAALFAAWRYWQKRRAVKAIIVAIPAHERARRKLEAALDLYDQPKPFCTVVSDAVRLYLEERFGLRAPERTTDEFLGDLSRSAALTHVQKQSLEQFLSACDMVKFARYEPQRPELETLYNSALRLIEETIPEAKPTDSSGNTRVPSVAEATAKTQPPAK